MSSSLPMSLAPLRTLSGLPYPDECGKLVGTTEQGATCGRDRGHGGKHKPYPNPACDYCGAEYKLRGLVYSCDHSRLKDDRAETLRTRDQRTLANARRALTYAMAGFPASGNAPTTEQYQISQRIVCGLLDADPDLIDVLDEIGSAVA